MSKFENKEQAYSFGTQNTPIPLNSKDTQENKTLLLGKRLPT